MLVSLSVRFSRVLCLIAATNFVTATSEHSAKLLIFSVRKVENSGSDWLSASAAADVMLVSLRVRFSRVLCLIAATNFVTASSEHLAKRRSRWMMFPNLGIRYESCSAPFDDKQQHRIDKQHLRSFGTCCKKWLKESLMFETSMSSKWLQCLTTAPRLSIERLVPEHLRTFKNFRLNCPELSWT